MAALILPRRFSNQPQQLPQIDWSNPLTRGLQYAFVAPWSATGTSSSNIVTNTASRGVFTQGVTANTSGSASYISFSASSAFFSNQWTSLSVASFSSVTGANNAISTVADTPGSGTTDRSIFTDSSGHLSVYIFDGGLVVVADTVSLSANTPYVLGGSTNGSSLNVWKNGKLAATTSCANGGFGYGGTPPVHVLGYCPGGSGASPGSSAQIALQAWWVRDLSAAEQASFAANPWQIFKAPQRRIWAAANAGITFDAASNSSYQTGTASLSWTHTNGGNFLAVDVEVLSVPGTTVTAATYDGVAMSFLGAKSTVSGAGRVECWGLVAPSIGAKTVAVTLSASVACAGTAASYGGVHQTTPTEAFNSAQATNVGAADATVTVTPIADNCWIHGACVSDDTSITANQTSRNNVTGALGSGADEDTGSITPATATAVSYTGVGALATWAIAGYAIRPLSASGAVTGTLARTNANDTSAAAGTTTITGTLARTNANDTGVASGTTTVTGSLARTSANDSVAASGSVGSAITGTLATTNAGDGVAASGTTTVTGALAKANGNDSLSASGTTTVVGALARTNADDALSAAGWAGSISGSLAYTNANDICYALGTTGRSPQPDTGPLGGGGGYSGYVPGRKHKKSLATVVGELFDMTVKELYGAAADENSTVAQQAEKLVEPFALKKDGPALEVIDWKALEADAERVAALIELWNKAEMRKIDDDDEDILLLSLME